MRFGASWLGSALFSLTSCDSLRAPGFDCSDRSPCTVLRGPDDPAFDETSDAELLRVAEEAERQHRLLNSPVGAFPGYVVVGGSDWSVVASSVLAGEDPWPRLTQTQLADFHGRLAYASLALGASAIRYRVLLDARSVVDPGASERSERVEQAALARETLLRDVATINRAFEVTGTSSVVALRVLVSHDLPVVDFPEALHQIPLRDAVSGRPLPDRDERGRKPRTWRAGRGPPGLGPWQDGVGDVDFLGFALAAALTWEAAEGDESLRKTAAVEALRIHASGLLQQLRTLREDGRDLVYIELDGRPSDRAGLRPEDELLFPGLRAAYALSISAALSFVTEMPDDRDFAHQLGQRAGWRDWLAGISEEINREPPSPRMSIHHAATTALWTAARYVDEPELKAELQRALQNVYRPKHRIYFRLATLEVAPLDLMAFDTRQQATSPLSLEQARARVIAGLTRLGSVPFVAEQVTFCEENGRGLPSSYEFLTAESPLLVFPPLAAELRGRGFYEWVIDPHRINLDCALPIGVTIAPPTDFRWAYWLGRLIRRST